MIDSLSDDNLSRLYSNISKEYNVPDINTFRADMADSAKRRRLHETLIKDNYNVPDFNTFSTDMGFESTIPNAVPPKQAEPKAPAAPGQSKQQSVKEQLPSEKFPSTSKKGEDLTQLNAFMDKQQKAKDFSPMFGEEEVKQKNASEFVERGVNNKAANIIKKDAEFQAPTITDPEKDLVSFETYNKKTQQKAQAANEDLEIWELSTVSNYQNKLSQLVQQDPEFAQRNNEIGQKQQQFADQLKAQVLQQIDGQEIDANQAKMLNDGIKQDMQKYTDQLNEEYKPKFDAISGKYYNTITTEFQAEYKKKAEELMRPDTKLLPEPLIEYGNKLVSSDVFADMSYSEKQNALLTSWKRLSQQLKKQGKTEGQILAMRDEYMYALMPKVLYDEKRNITAFGIRSFAEDQMEELDKKLAEAKARLQKVSSENPGSQSIAPSIAEFSNESIAVSPVVQKQKEEVDKLIQAREALTYVLDLPDEDAGGFIEGFLKDGIRNKIPFVSAMLDISDLARTKTVADKQRKLREKQENKLPIGPEDELTDSEQLLLNAESAESAIDQAVTPSMWYNAGSAAAQSISYMGEFLATSGVFDGTYQAAKAGLTKTLGSFAKRKSVESMILKPVSALIAIEAQTAANPQQYVKNTLERMSPGMQLAMSDDANQVISVLDWNTKQLNGYNTGHGEDAGTAFVKGFLLTSAEVGTERFGEAATKFFKWAGQKKGLDKILNPELMKRLTLGYYMEKYGLSISDAKKHFITHSLGWDGFGNEFFVEEIPNIPLTNLITGDQAVSSGFLAPEGKEQELLDWQNLGTIAISIGATTGVMSAAQLAMSRPKKTTVHYRDPNGNVVPVVLKEDTWAAILKAQTYSFDELTKFKNETLPKLKAEGNARNWLNAYVDGLLEKKQQNGNPNAAPTTNSPVDEAIIEVATIAQEQAQDLVDTLKPDEVETLLSVDPSLTPNTQPNAENETGNEEKGNVELQNGEDAKGGQENDQQKVGHEEKVLNPVGSEQTPATETETGVSMTPKEIETELGDAFNNLPASDKKAIREGQDPNPILQKRIDALKERIQQNADDVDIVGMANEDINAINKFFETETLLSVDPSLPPNATVKEVEVVKGFYTPSKNAQSSKLQSGGLPVGKFIALDAPFTSNVHDAKDAQKIEVNLKGKKIYNPDAVEGFPPTEDLSKELSVFANSKIKEGKKTFEELMTEFYQSKGYDAYVRLIDGGMRNNERELIIFDRNTPLNQQSPTQNTPTNESKNENGIQEGGKNGKENVTEGLQGQGEKGGQKVNQQKEGELLNPQSIPRKDVDFTAKGGNKIVDEKGYPLSVYHATDAEFDEFDDDKKGTNTGFDNTIHGFFFAEKPENTEQFGKKTVIEANIYLKKPIDLRIDAIFNNKEQASTIAEILFDQKLGPQEALDLINQEIDLGEVADMREALNSKKANDILKQNGYDGIISDMGNNQVEYIVFDKEAIRIKSKNESNTQTEERSTEALITEGEAIEAEAANHKPGESSKSILQKIEDHINSLNAKIVKLTENWDESELPPDEQAGRQAGKAAKKEVRKYAGEVARLLGWNAWGIHDNIAPAGGDVNFRLEIPDTPLEMWVAIKYEPNYDRGAYENYKIDQFFYRVEKQGKSVGPNQWMFFNKPQFGLKQEASIPTPKQLALIFAKEAAPYIDKYGETQKKATDAVIDILENGPSERKNVQWGYTEDTFVNEGLKRKNDDQDIAITRAVVDEMLAEMKQIGHPNYNKFNSLRADLVLKIDNAFRSQQLKKANEKIQGIVTASGAPKANVIVGGVSPVVHSQANESDFDAELKALAEEFAQAVKDSRGNLTMSGIDTKVLALGGKLVAKLLEKNIYKFADMVKSVAKMGIEITNDLIEAMKKVYLATQSDLSDEVLDQMNNLQDLRKITVADFTTEQKNQTNEQATNSPAPNPGGPSAPPVSNGVQSDNGTENVQGEQPNQIPGGQSGPSVQDDANAGTARKNRGGGGGRNSTNVSGANRGGNGTSQSTDTSQGSPANNELTGTVDNSSNFKITEQTVIVPSTETEKIKANIRAIEIIKQLEAEDRLATDQEKEELAKYTGWGGLSELLNTEKYNNKELYAGWHAKYAKYYEKVVSLLSSQEFESAQNSTINAHYTDREVIKDLWGLVDQLGFTGGQVLESSMGVGHFFGLMPERYQNVSRLIGYELDPTSGAIAQALYPASNVRIRGFETANEKPGTVDLAITNVPFGKYSPQDERYPDLSKFNLHNYFIAKNMIMVKPGGLGVFITSSGSMDSAGSTKFRDWMVNEGNSDFVGAIRLPSNAFEKNAGTQVTTDIMVFRKRTGIIPSPFALDFRNIEFHRVAQNKDGENIDILINQYYQDNPDMMLGEMMLADEAGSGGMFSGNRQTLQAPPGFKIGKELPNALSKLPEKIFGADGEIPVGISNESTDVPEGTVVPKNGKTYISSGGILELADWTGKTTGTKKNPVSTDQVFLDYQSIKDALKTLIKLEQTEPEGADLSKERAALNKAYDSFVKKYGEINGQGTAIKIKALNGDTIRFLEDDIEFNMVGGLESIKKAPFFDSKKGVTTTRKFIEKAEIFKNRVTSPIVIPTTAASAQDAMTISSIYKGNVDLDYMQSLTGMSKEALIDDLVNSKNAFFDPITSLLVPREDYLSGNVRKKLKEAEAAVATNSKLKTNVEELSKVVPLDKPISLINVKIGSGWIPSEIYKKFALAALGVKGSFSYSEISGKWQFDGQVVDEVKAGQFQTDRVGIEKTLTAALNNQQIVVRDTIDNGISKTTVINQAATDQASLILQDLALAFDDYVHANEDIGKEVERLFNDKFNSYVDSIRQAHQFVDGSFPGASPVIKLREHQNKGAIRCLKNSTLLAHQVGTGKTFTMITAAMEMKRLGLAKKPMIVVHNSTLGSFLRDFKKLYPGAKILAPGTKERNSKQRNRLFSAMAYNEWDAIIIPQSFLDFIPDDKQREAGYIREQIEEMLAVMNDTKEHYMKSRLKKEIEGLQEELTTLEYEANGVTIVKDSEGKMVGYEMYDENGNAIRTKDASAIRDKVAEIKTKKSNVKNDANKRLSRQKIFDRQKNRRTDKTLTFENMGIDALFIDEAHRYKKLGFNTSMTKIKGIDTKRSKTSFGAYMKMRWVQEKNNGRNVVLATGTPITNTIAEIWTMFRYLAPETIKEMGIQNFDQFVNTFAIVEDAFEFTAAGTLKPAQRFRSYMNVKQLIDAFKKNVDVVLTEDVPEFKQDNTIPKLKGGGLTPVLMDQTEEMQSLMQGFVNQLEAYEKLSGKEKKANSHIPLTVFTEAKKAAIDVRLVDPNLEDNPNSKVNNVIKNAMEIYRETDSYKGTQLIFSDIYQSREQPEFIGEGIRNPLYGQPRFNLYRDIKNKLIQQGVPESEILIVNDVLNKDALANKWEDVNIGKIRFLIGSSEKMGVGVNVQTLLKAMHHIDAPFMPMHFEQRMGRMVRQGNLHALSKENGGFDSPVVAFTYGILKTMDVNAYQILAIKQKFINSFLKGDVEDGQEEMTEEVSSGAGFTEMMAQLTGSNVAVLYFQKVQEEKKLVAAVKNNERKISELEKKKKDIDALIVAYPKTIARLNQSFAELNGSFTEGDKVSEVTIYTPEGPITHAEKPYKQIDDYLKPFIDKLVSAISSTEIDSAEAKIHSITVGKINLKFRIVKRSNGNIEIVIDEFNQERAPFTFINPTAASLVSAARKYVDNVGKEKTRLEQNFTKAPQQLIDIEKELAKPFTKDQDLRRVKLEIRDLKKVMDEEFELEGKKPNQNTEQENIDQAYADAEKDFENNASDPAYTGLEEEEPVKGKLPIQQKKGAINVVGPYFNDINDILDSMRWRANNSMFSLIPPFGFLPATWNLALDVFKAALATVKTVEEAINQAIDYLRTQPLAPGVSSMVMPEQDIKDYLTLAATNPSALLTPSEVVKLRAKVKQGLKAKYTAFEIKYYGSPTKTDADFKKVYTNPVIAAQNLLDKPNKVAGNVIAGVTRAGLTSDWAAIRFVAKLFKSVFQNLERDQDWVLRSEKMKGAADSRAITDAMTAINEMRKLLANEPDALQRIDQVLDPEIYKKKNKENFLKDFENFHLLNYGYSPFNSFKIFSGTVIPGLTAKEQQALYDDYLNDPDSKYNNPTVKYDDLTAAEKAVHDMIRDIYDMIHDMNFVMKKVSFPTYLLNKGKYSARMYDFFEVPEDIKKEVGELNRLMQLDMYKERGGLTSWKIDNNMQDPTYKLGKRLFQTMVNQAVYDYASYVAKNRRFAVSSTPKPGFVRLQGRAYGVLHNKYVMKDLAEDFRGFFFANDTMQKLFEIMKAVYYFDPKGTLNPLKLASVQWYKRLFTVLTPATMLGNRIGNVVFATTIGIPPTEFNLYYHGFAIGEMKDMGSTARYLMDRGLLNSDISMDDVRKSANNLSLISGQTAPKLSMLYLPTKNLIGKVASGKMSIDELKKYYAENPLTVAGDIMEYHYHATDDLAKIAAFKALVDSGTPPEMAANKIAESFQNRHRVGSAYKVAAMIPIFGPIFGSFAGDMVRITLKNYTRTPLTYGIFLAALSGLASMLSVGSGEDPDKRKIREDRPGFAKIPQFNFSEDPNWSYIPILNFFGPDIPLQYKVKLPEINFGDGSYSMVEKELNLARFLSPLYLYSSNDDSDAGEFIKKLSPLPIDFVEAEEARNPTGSLAVMFAKNNRDPRFAWINATKWVDSDFTGKAVSDRKATENKPSLLTQEEKTHNAVAYLFRSYFPYGQMVDDLRRVNKDGKDYYLRDRTNSQIILRFFGYNAQQFPDTKYREIVENKLENKVYTFLNNEKLIFGIEKEFKGAIIEDLNKLIKANPGKYKDLTNEAVETLTYQKLKEAYTLIRENKEIRVPHQDLVKRLQEKYIKQADLLLEAQTTIIDARRSMTKEAIDKILKDISMNKRSRTKLNSPKKPKTEN